MNHTKVFITFLGILISGQIFMPVSGQHMNPVIPGDYETHSPEDTLAHELGKSDSTETSLSDNIYNLIYKSIFIDTTRRRDLTYIDDFSESQNIFIPFTGKRIGKIYRRNVQIFGGSIHDTTEIPTTGLTNLASKIHIDTRDAVIMDNMIVATGDTIDPFRLADNERILRSLPFIHDVKIIPIVSDDIEDVVDLIIITQDVFSIGVGGSASSPENFKLNLYERNLLGMGWEINNEFHFNAARSPELGYDGKFFISNISGTFVSGLINYAKLYENDVLRLSLNRSFLTPQTKYAGGLEVSYKRNYLDLKDLRKLNYSSLAQDYWIGRAFQLHDASNRKNLTISLRYYRDDFKDRPLVKPDSNFAFHDYSYFLSGIYLTKILYFKSSLVLGFGHTEDIPYGYNLNLTAGYGNTEFEERMYAGIRLRGATFSDKFGYILGTASAGSFYDGQRMEDGVINLGWLYFTNMFNLGADYKLRQFVSGSYTIGFHRLNDDQLDLEREHGVSIFDSDKLRGSQRVELSLQSIVFSPWNWFGFRFAIEGFLDVGWIGSNYKPPDVEKINSAIGLIFRLRNDNLVLSTFQIGFAYFPNSVAGSKNFNWGFSTSEPRLLGQLEGRKPAIIPFR